MPCTQTGSLAGDRALAATQENEYLSDQITELTALLCEACGALENETHFFACNIGDLYDWWIEHQESDKLIEDIRLRDHYISILDKLPVEDAEWLDQYVNDLDSEGRHDDIMHAKEDE
jgi:hypothetical protein